MTSATLTKLAPALIKVQKELKSVEKNRTNPFYKSKYADLESIWTACKEVLGKNGFAIVQTTGLDGMQFALCTTLLHESGELLQGFYPLQPAKANDPQSLAACVTYARRIALAAILSMVTDDDDDGNAAVQGATQAAPSTSPSVPEPIKTPRPTSKPVGAGQKTTLPKFSVKSKSFKSKKGNDVTSWQIINEDGFEFGTIDKNVAQIALDAEKNGQAISVYYTQNGKFFTAERIEVVQLEEVGF